MWFLFLEIFVWLFISFALGMFVMWFFCCRKKEAQESSVNFSGGKVESAALAPTEKVAATPVAETGINSSWKPSGFSERPDDADDLKRVKGIGAVIERTLNELGIFKFEQIAEWTEDNVAWVDNFISFPGRIKREDWVEQTKDLARGHVTEFAARVDKGDVGY